MIDPQHLWGHLAEVFSRLRNKVPEAQKLFQEDNGLPVHIKGGTSDVMLYRATMILSGIGTCYSLYWLLLAAAPQKNA
uniref:Cytochrome c oxidase subunit 7A1, mitochondrial n=1 Tax=Takifugu rubripes TaxID=31033 RepID=A0A674NFS4_TAKRU